MLDVKKELQQLTDDLKKVARLADLKDKERADLFASLIKNQAWLAFYELLNLRIEAQGSLLLNPAGSVDGVLVGEYEKGTMRGLIIARDLPSLIIEAMKALASETGNEGSDNVQDGRKVP